jgi:hypothetical protein
MAITVEARTSIIELVVGMFGAAPGASVLSDLVASYEAGATLKQIAANLANTNEFKSIFPTFLTNAEFATKVVNQLVGSEVVQAEKDAAITTLTSLLNGGQSRSSVFVDAISAVNAVTSTNTAWANAGAAFDNKVAVAVYYSVDKQLSGTTLAGLQNVIATTTSAAASVTAAKASVDGTFNTGSTFTFTTAVDSFNGGANNDVFNAADTTLTAADSLTGGAGIDTLNFTNSTAAAALPAASITGIEVLNVRAVGNALNATDLSALGGLTTFNADRSNASVTVTNLASGGSFGIIGDNSITNATAYAFGSVAAATAQTLNVSGGTKGAATVTLTGAAVKATTINSTGLANTIGALTLAATSDTLTIDAATTLTTGTVTAAGITNATGDLVTLKGAGGVTTDLSGVAVGEIKISNGDAVATGTLNNATIKVDGSAATGAITTTLGTSTAMVFTGGSGNDIVTAGAILAAGAAVDAGAGTDRITFTANGQLTKASGAKYTNFEVLQATGVTDIDMDNIAGITALRTSGNATFTNVTATQAGAITTVAGGALNIGVKDAATVGQLDTVSITTSSTNAAVAIATLAVADVETINLTASTGTGLTSITTLAHDDWQFLNLKGSSAITVTSTATAAVINTKVDGSAATGILTLDFALTTTNGVQILGGSAADVITGTALADSISGGAGIDTITGGNGADTLTGGDGADIFISVAAATATDGNGVGIDVITDFNTGGADILRLAAANDVAGAGGTANATATVSVAAGGKASFAAADDTLAEMITTLVNDGAITANEVVFFELGGSTYVYGAGATADGSDDFMIKLTGVTGRTTLTESTTTAGDFTLA